MNAQDMKKALKALDVKLTQPVNLLVGGGAAMLLAHEFPLTTADIDALVFKSSLTQVEIDPYVKEVSQELNLPPDWLNGYFNVFLFTLPKDYTSRLKNIFTGKHLNAMALGAEDLLVLKCFAGRAKDVGHAKALYKKIKDISIVTSHLDSLSEKRIPGTQKALDFFYEIEEQCEG